MLPSRKLDKNKSLNCGYWNLEWANNKFRISREVSKKCYMRGILDEEAIRITKFVSPAVIMLTFGVFWRFKSVIWLFIWQCKHTPKKYLKVTQTYFFGWSAFWRQADSDEPDVALRLSFPVRGSATCRQDDCRGDSRWSAASRQTSRFRGYCRLSGHFVRSGTLIAFCMSSWARTHLLQRTKIYLRNISSETEQCTLSIQESRNG